MITLASDFGSPYPAAMKGVVLRHTEAQLVDVAHDFPRQDVRAAAFWLREVLPWFPPAVHLVVVDPGVGTDRAAIAVRAGDHALVGPDNGVLLPAARALAAASGDGSNAGEGADPDAAIDVYEIEYGEGGPRPDVGPAAPAGERSTTFHGRDVFAPAAGRLHEVGIEAFVERDDVVPAAGYEDLRLPTASVDRDAGRADGEVLVVDGFGNAITNVPGDVLAAVDEVVVNGERAPAVETFAAVDPGERLATVGSHGNVELDVNRGRGDEAFGLEPGDRVELRW